MRTSLFLIALSLVQTAGAQIEKHSSELGKTLLECRYECVQKYDTLGTKVVTDTMILRIGSKKSQFYAHSAFYADSLANDSQGKEVLKKKMMESIMSGKEAPGFKILGLGEYYYKNYPEGKLTAYAFREKALIMEESYQPQVWTLVEGTKVVGGYSCKKAVCTFRGRNYIAWYTPDINHSEGPWKFNGLPGLIVEVFDEQEHYRFTLLEVDAAPASSLYLYMSDKPTVTKERVEYLKDRAANYHRKKESAEKRGKNIPAYDFLERDYH